MPGRRSCRIDPHLGAGRERLRVCHRPQDRARRFRSGRSLTTGIGRCRRRGRRAGLARGDDNRDGTFTDVTEKAGLSDAGWAMGVCVATTTTTASTTSSSPTTARTASTTTTATAPSPTSRRRPACCSQASATASGCTFIERNRNGLLDLFVANYLDVDLVHGPKPSMADSQLQLRGVPVNCGPIGLPALTHYLYRNNGDGTFTDVSKESGIAALSGSFGLTAVALDADEDGWPDIFVACDSDLQLSAHEQPRRHLPRRSAAPRHRRQLPMASA